jgi:hypothetical protein
MLTVDRLAARLLARDYNATTGVVARLFFRVALCRTTAPDPLRDLDETGQRVKDRDCSEERAR